MKNQKMCLLFGSEEMKELIAYADYHGLLVDEFLVKRMIFHGLNHWKEKALAQAEVFNPPHTHQLPESYVAEFLRKEILARPGQVEEAAEILADALEPNEEQFLSRAFQEFKTRKGAPVASQDLFHRGATITIQLNPEEVEHLVRVATKRGKLITEEYYKQLFLSALEENLSSNADPKAKTTSEEPPASAEPQNEATGKSRSDSSELQDEAFTLLEESLGRAAEQFQKTADIAAVLFAQGLTNLLTNVTKAVERETRRLVGNE